ncbi:pyridoxal 5'-phosphate synthase glutaminase subunit PdxT [Caldiplasma sukawensis]
MNIAVIGYQGDVEEHLEMLSSIGSKGFNVNTYRARSTETLKNADGIVIPGGESTTIYKLTKEYGLYDMIIQLASSGVPVMGTCAGIILLSRETNDTRVQGMGLLNVSIERNGYGRQGDSFQRNISVNGIGDFNAVFIRAPVIKSTGENVDILAYEGNRPVMVRQGNIIGMTFHPELTEDTRIHVFFLNMIKEREGYTSQGKIKERVA